MQPGRIVLLNGASRSGTSPLVPAVRAAVDGLWLEVGVDTAVLALPEAWLNPARPPRPPARGEQP